MRTDRSGRPLLLLLAELVTKPGRRSPERDLSRRAIDAVTLCIRRTDVAGWYKNGSVIGVVFTELVESPEVAEIIAGKVTIALRERLKHKQRERVRVSTYRYPNVYKRKGVNGTANGSDEDRLYPGSRRKSSALFCKRVLDFLGSSALIAMLSPLLAGIALAIRLTSPGPVFFRQTRIGCLGKPFTMLKFRSMYQDSDSRLHEEYVKRYIAASKNGASGNGNGNGNGVALATDGQYKLHDDPRITPVGRFLRTSSLDELPQLFNVLKGEMALVGPRPPLAYEVEQYEIWHRRRVIEAKPGMTGLWQVNGRNRTSFDDMVRLDLKYVNDWTLWTDIRILLRTPGAVWKGAR